MALIDAAISRTRTVLASFVLILVAGFYAYHDIPKESDPDIDIPLIYISMALEGISPDDAERLLLRPMEQELSGIEGTKQMSSSGYTGGGFVLLEFQAGFDKDRALDDVQKAVDQVRPKLPDDVDEPSVSEVNFSLFPILAVTLSGDVPERALLRLARRLQDKVEAIPSVLEVNISGDREELVEIIIDPVLLESYSLQGEDLINFFNRSNRLVAAGKLDTGMGRFEVKVPGLFETTQDILSMPIKTEGDSVIQLSDVAYIRRTFRDPDNFARINGRPAVALNVVKRTGDNIIETIEAVRDVVSEERQLWPESVQVTFTLDRSTDIRNMLRDLQNNIISAVLLVMIVVVAVLGLRSALLIGIAIPGAFLSGILILYTMGLSVNIVVLFSLILSVGMLVDGAIVVTEYADRKMSEGLDRVDAYALAARRMTWPITASTATTLAAFAPLLFWPGMAGEFMKYMPITLIGVLLSSLAMALIFVPVIGAVIGKRPAGEAAVIPGREDTDLSQIKGLTGWYVRRLDFLLNHPVKVLCVALFMLVGVQFAYGKLGKGVEFFPDIEPNYASVFVHARGNLSAFEQDMIIRQVEEQIIGIGGVKTFYTEAGKQNNQGNDAPAEDVIGKITLELESWDARPMAKEIFAEIRRRSEAIPGIMIEVRENQEGPPSGKDIQLELSSFSPESLSPAVETVLKAMQEIGGFIAIEDSRPLPGIEWELEVNRAEASKYGIDISVLGQYVRMITNGLIVGEYRPNDSDEEIDIVVRHEREDRSLDQLDDIRIETAQGSMPIIAFVDRVARPQVGTVNRVEQKRVITIKADLEPGLNTAAMVEKLREWMIEHAQIWDPSVEVTFRGDDEDQREAQQFLGKAFLVALFIMAIILVTQFNSFYSAFLILSAVIMSTIGVFLGLMFLQQPFGIIMSGVGVIALAGIIVNNNIVLIDTYDSLVNERGLSVRKAILLTGAQRLRPVLLTTITTILGLMPMVLQLNIDFIAREVSHGAPSTQWWVQLATAIVFGLGFSTVLTLGVTPSLLMLRQRAKDYVVRKRFLSRPKQH